MLCLLLMVGWVFPNELLPVKLRDPGTIRSRCMCAYAFQK